MPLSVILKPFLEPDTLRTKIGCKNLNKSKNSENTKKNYSELI